MGHTDVFVHVGDQVKVQARNGKWVAPLVTGRVDLQAALGFVLKLDRHVRVQ